ncbi:hypothetical protein [Virgibacillus salexigens]|uniref:Endolytic transglycosylase MltG n=1 Tax=Virgibacillus kapii TaxID=1638645 RepID=A0ABQ2D969_9BACI|nr:MULTISPECIES: hypothetical protein [Virgibacillus]MYL41759.1 hypothetical protein [Virgibacillus massiliensis]GGJ47820.1 hypothetical protein GCM10007111_07290 [Virgibacillus kapii]
MKQPIRMFGIGLLTAGVIMLGTYFFFSGSVNTVDNLTNDELVSIIEEKGYHVLSNSEYIAASVNESSAQSEESKENNKNAESDNSSTDQEKEDSANDKEKDQAEEDKPKTYTLHIEEGMASSDISSSLEENEIIDDSSEFNDYMEENDYSLRVQLGEFEVNSDMSLYEIAEAITR